MVPFIVTNAPTVSGVAVGGAVLAAAGETMFGPDTAPPVTVYSVAGATGMTDVRGQPLVRGVTYLRHPRSSRHPAIIRSAEFHSYIMSQKVAEIVRYMRSETRLKCWRS